MFDLHELPTGGEDCQRVAKRVQPDYGAGKMELRHPSPVRASICSGHILGRCIVVSEEGVSTKDGRRVSHSLAEAP